MSNNENDAVAFDPFANVKIKTSLAPTSRDNAPPVSGQKPEKGSMSAREGEGAPLGLGNKGQAIAGDNENLQDALNETAQKSAGFLEKSSQTEGFEGGRDVNFSAPISSENNSLQNQSVDEDFNPEGFRMSDDMLFPGRYKNVESTTPKKQQANRSPQKIKPSKSTSRRISEATREKIKENALAEGYRSDAPAEKETTKTFAYTFYPSDVRAVRRIKMSIMEDEISLNVSDSEMMRAGVAALKALPYEEQKRLVLAQKKR